MRGFVIRAMALTLAALSSAFGQVAPAAPQIPHIAASGTGEARVTPDRASVFIGVQSRAATAAAAGADNARRQKAVIDTLRALGIPSDQITTTNYLVSPEMRYEPSSQISRVTGYLVSNQVRVEVRRIEQVGSIIDAALARGANEMSSLQFFSSLADEARRTALAQAVAKAKADAEVMAKAAGGTLGSLLELSSLSIEMPRPVMSVMRMADKAATTPIEPGEQTFQASVSARWAFLPAK